VDARNNLDGMVYRVEKSIAELGDDLDAAVKTEVEAAVAKAKTVLEGDDVDAITAAASELEHASHKLAEALYKKAQAEGASADEDGARANGASAASKDNDDDDDNVVDADFEEVKNP